MQAELRFVVEVAQEAGEILLKFFGGELTKKIKRNPEDFATEADEAAEEFILKQIREKFPSDSIVAEESGVHGREDAEYSWIVDPLDGTHHFANGSKDFGVMICRARRGEVVLAVVWNPAKKILAVAEKGSGVKLQGSKVRLPQDDQADLPMSVENDAQEMLKSVGYGVTNLGASANTLVTLAGERRAFVSSNGYVWDFAPAALMFEEAGWNVTDLKGQPFRWDGTLAYGYPGIIAAPEDLHMSIFDAFHG